MVVDQVVVGKLVSKVAVALMVGQIFSDAPQIQTQFDAEKDSAKIIQTLNFGCNYLFDYAKKVKPELMKDFDPESELKETAERDERFQPHLEIFLTTCKNQPPTEFVKSFLPKVVDYYNAALKDLEADKKKTIALKDVKLPQSSVAYDSNNKKLGDIFSSGNRRNFIAIKDVPPLVRYAFLAAEDKNFYTRKHKGLDESGVLRAAESAKKGGGKHPVGGSTITQQVIKNLVVGDKVEESRKIREMYLSVLLEETTTKDRILELYMNQIYFGYSSWGVKTAAEAYFGVAPKELKPVQAAFLAALAKCPKSCGPSNPDNLKARTKYAVEQLGKFITPEGKPALSQDQVTTALEELNSGLQFKPFFMTKSYAIDKLAEAAKAQFGVDPTERQAAVRTTINGPLQIAAEEVAQEGAAAYQIKWGSAKFTGAEANLKDQAEKMNWVDALKQASLPLADVRWEPVLVLAKNDIGATVGLRDGRTMTLAPWYNSKLPLKEIKQWDVVYALIHEATGKSQKTYAELRFRPTVQVAAMIMKNDGRILSMVGGFSRYMNNDEFNRAVDAKRSPGSTIKSIFYLKALQAGIQPTQPIRNGKFSYEEMDWLGTDWNPDNYEGGSSGPSYVTFRHGLEESYNQVLVRLWPTIAAKTGQDPQTVLNDLFNAVKDVGIAPVAPKFVPDLLGTFDVTMLNMATFYSTIANLGCKPSPRLIESIEVDGANYPYQVPPAETKIDSSISCADPSMTPTPASVADGVSFYQLRSILQGVPVRGTGAGVGSRLSNLIPANGGNIGDYLALKTGTSNGWRDAWMIGFTQDITIAVWVGFDGEKRKPGDKTKTKSKTLGYDAQGAKVAGPIFEGLFRAAKNYIPLRPFDGPPQNVAQQLTRVASGSVIDYIRRNPNDPNYMDQDQQFARQGEDGYYIDPNNDPSQNYVTRLPRPRRGFAPGPMDSDMADYGQPYDDRPTQQPYVPNRNSRIPQQRDFFSNLFGGGWAQQYDEEEERPRVQQQPRSRQPQRQQRIQPQQAPGWEYNPFNNRW